MLQSLAWQTTDRLARAQLAMMREIGDMIHLTEDDPRRILHLDDAAWAEWNDFRQGGPLPAYPPLPEMLLRVAKVAYDMCLIAERGDRTLVSA